MTDPVLSAHFESRQPSDIRVAQIRFGHRTDAVEAINVAIGNVSLPMHPAMTERLHNLSAPHSPFADGRVTYGTTVGTPEANQAFLNIIASSGFDTAGLHSQITDGGSQAMELVIIGVCGPAGGAERPLLLIDPAYTNYAAFAERLGRPTVTITRTLEPNGRFSLPSMSEIESVITRHKPGGLVVIPYDNPTGQFYDRDTMVNLARLCVQHNLWMISDEAYRELFYIEGSESSVWGVTEEEVPGITGRRISIETASKVWNACGLRIGAIVTDDATFHAQAVAENTANLCPNVIGQYVFGSLAQLGHAELQEWYANQRSYYQKMLTTFADDMRECLPGVIVSRPDASLYSVVDVREVQGPDFDARDFVQFCASEGGVDVDGRLFTVLTAPMAGFYTVPSGTPNPGRTQMRIAYVESPERMAMVPRLLARLLADYRERAG